jgi:hypothetical protein
MILVNARGVFWRREGRAFHCSRWREWDLSDSDVSTVDGMLHDGKAHGRVSRKS